MRKILLIIATVILMSSCSTDPENSLLYVKQAFPNAKIYKGDRRWTFYVVDSVGIREVNCLNITNDKISDVTMMVKQ